MSFTSQLGGPNHRPLWPLTLLLLCAVACTRPAGTPTDQSALESDHQAPFRQDAAAGDDSDSSENRETPPNTLPFHDSQNLPAGTLLTVRLSNPVYAETSIASSSFEGLVVEPVVVEGNVIVPRGAIVSGLVESVRASQVKPSRGYVRLTLQSIQMVFKMYEYAKGHERATEELKKAQNAFGHFEKSSGFRSLQV